jgi:hypothetical protein
MTCRRSGHLNGCPGSAIFVLQELTFGLVWKRGQRGSQVRAAPLTKPSARWFSACRPSAQKFTRRAAKSARNPTLGMGRRPKIREFSPSRRKGHGKAAGQRDVRFCVYSDSRTEGIPKVGFRAKWRLISVKMPPAAPDRGRHQDQSPFRAIRPGRLGNATRTHRAICRSARVAACSCCLPPVGSPSVGCLPAALVAAGCVLAACCAPATIAPHATSALLSFRPVYSPRSNARSCR